MPEYSGPELISIARSQKALICFTLMFAVSLSCFSVVAVHSTLEWNGYVDEEKTEQEGDRLQELRGAVIRPETNTMTSEPFAGLVFLQFLWICYSHLPYEPAVATGILCLIFVFLLARALRLPCAWLWPFLMFVPALGLFVWLWLICKATRTLRSNGIAVGFMGAKKTEPATLSESC